MSAAGPVWDPPPAAAPPVVVVGDLMTDVVVRMAGPLAAGSDTPARIGVRGGGSAANLAAWLACLDVPVAFAGRVGDDAAGRTGVAELTSYGVSCHVTTDPDRPTGTCVVLVAPDGERSMLPDPGANGALAEADLPRGLFRPGRHLHLSGYVLLDRARRPAGLAALARARDHRMTTSVDPSSAALLAAVGPAEFLSWTRGVDLVLANAEEAAVLTGAADPRVGAERLAADYREAVVTLGAAGAVWHGGFLGARAAAATVQVVDSTGAGDAFGAGFLAEWLLHPEPESALAAANRLAAHAVVRVGARPPLPGWDHG